MKDWKIEFQDRLCKKIEKSISRLSEKEKEDYDKIKNMMSIGKLSHEWFFRLQEIADWCEKR